MVTPPHTLYQEGMDAVWFESHGLLLRLLVKVVLLLFLLLLMMPALFVVVVVLSIGLLHFLVARHLGTAALVSKVFAVVVVVVGGG